jgi:calcium-dependent protein kinase
MGCIPSSCQRISDDDIKSGAKTGVSTPIVFDEVLQRVSGMNNESFSARVHDDRRKLEDDYVVEKSKVVGSGYSGPVRPGTSRLTGKKVAVKSFNKKMLTLKRLEFLRNEVSVYLLLDHPNVTRLLDVYEDDKWVHLVMEFCAGKELYHRLVKKSRYSEKDAARTTYEMLLAINYLHQHNIVHRDIKLENFLYEDQSEDSKLKLIDFGFSRVWHPHERLQASCGSIQYVAPEVLRGNYGSQCDMWSLGVIVYMILSGGPPFDGYEDEVLENIRIGNYKMKGNRWKSVSDQAKDFVKRLLVVDPKARMTAAEALNHPWISNQGHIADADVPREVLENLRCFAQLSHLRRAALSMLAYTLTSDELSDLHDVFLSIDHNKEGTIQPGELIEVMKDKLGISEEEVNEIFGKLDRTHQGKIEYTTFIAASMANRIKLHDNLVRHVFDQLDANGDGQISLEDLRAVLGETIDGEDINVLLQEADTDGDGRIDYDEFERCFNMIQIPAEAKPQADNDVPPPLIPLNRQTSRATALAKLRAVSALSKAAATRRRSLTHVDTSSLANSGGFSPIAQGA